MPAYSLEIIKNADKLYQEGNSIRMVSKLSRICTATLEKWIKKGLILSRNHKDAIKLASLKGRMRGASMWNEKSKHKQRLNMLRRIEENPMNHPNRKLAGNRNKMSFPERLVFDSLTNAKIEFKHNNRVGRYYPDFIIGNKIFEIDGERWHDPVRDAIRDKVLIDMGFTVERIPAKVVLKNPNIVLHRLQVL